MQWFDIQIYTYRSIVSCRACISDIFGKNDIMGGWGNRVSNLSTSIFSNWRKSIFSLLEVKILIKPYKKHIVWQFLKCSPEKFWFCHLCTLCMRPSDISTLNACIDLYQNKYCIKICEIMMRIHQWEAATHPDSLLERRLDHPCNAVAVLSGLIRDRFNICTSLISGMASHTTHVDGIEPHHKYQNCLSS